MQVSLAQSIEYHFNPNTRERCRDGNSVRAPRRHRHSRSLEGLRKGNAYNYGLGCMPQALKQKLSARFSKARQAEKVIPGVMGVSLI
jgi:hypothetical protein